MSQTKKADRRRIAFSQVIGIVLTAYAVLMLAAVLFWIARKGYVDFPCEATLGPRPEVTESTRIAYCISAWPREMYGGGVYAAGTSDEDQVVLGPRASWPSSLALERRGQELLVDGQLLPPGQTYARFHWFPSSNPWLLATARLTVWYSTSTDVISVSGDVREGWRPNPLGLLILGIGVWLLIRGRRRRYDNVQIKNVVDGTTIEGHDAVKAYFEREKALHDAYGSSIIFQVYRINLQADTLQELQGEKLAEIKVDGDFVSGEDTAAAVKSKVRPLIEQQVQAERERGASSLLRIEPDDRITLIFDGHPMADDKLFYADHFMMLPAWVQVFLHACEFAEIAGRAAELRIEA